MLLVVLWCGVTGMWSGPGQEHISRIAQQCGVTTQPQWHTGTKLLDLDGVISTYTTDIPSLSYLGLLDLQLLLWTVDRARRSVPVTAAEDCERAMEWDAISCHSWVVGTARGVELQEAESHCVMLLMMLMMME